MSEIPEDFDFRTESDKMMLALRFLADVDVTNIARSVSEAHTIGPFLDPTMYRDALQSGHMDIAAALANALQEPLRIFREKVTPIIRAAI